MLRFARNDERETKSNYIRGPPQTSHFRRVSDLLQELGLEDEALHLFGVAFDVAGVAGEADVLHDGAALEGDGGALHLQILDDHYAIAIGKRVAVAVLHYIAHGVSLGSRVDGPL